MLPGHTFPAQSPNRERAPMIEKLNFPNSRLATESSVKVVVLAIDLYVHFLPRCESLKLGPAQGWHLQSRLKRNIKITIFRQPGLLSEGQNLSIYRFISLKSLAIWSYCQVLEHWDYYKGPWNIYQHQI
jgi:hypothetical protein